MKTWEEQSVQTVARQKLQKANFGDAEVETEL